MNALDDSANTNRCTPYEDSANFLKDKRFTKTNIRPRQTFERWTPRTQESPRKLARQSEAKRKQAPQSKANVCGQRKCNLKTTSVVNCTEHPIMHRTPNTNWGLRCHTSNATSRSSTNWKWTSVQKYIITDLPNIQENKHHYNNKIVHDAKLQKKRKTCENKLPN